jgi:NADP-dependent 3-hydroxy acid dehydrogenase YdfG
MTAAGSVLITGCSSGIGQAAALALQEGHRTVVATARNPATLSGLAGRGLRTLALDVTDEASMRAAVDAAGPIDVLVNNAGYGLYGTVEQLPMAEIRRQFETNFFGLVRLTQLVLPGMRAAGGGRILNVSSMGGRATLPGGAFYHAWHAVEALSDALRMRWPVRHRRGTDRARPAHPVERRRGRFRGRPPRQAAVATATTRSSTRLQRRCHRGVQHRHRRAAGPFSSQPTTSRGHHPGLTARLPRTGD